jgi:hypothetical protein
MGLVASGRGFNERKASVIRIEDAIEKIDWQSALTPADAGDFPTAKPRELRETKCEPL